jgi:transcription elongation factor Elf1
MLLRQGISLLDQLRLLELRYRRNHYKGPKSRRNVVDDEKLLKEGETKEQNLDNDLDEEITLLNGKHSGHRRTDPQTYAESVKHVVRQFKCSKCTHELESQGLLDAHVKTHEHTEPYKCDICQAIFQTNIRLKTHLNAEHAEKSLEDWSCNDCSFQANHPSELMNHLKLTTHQPSPNVTDKKKLFSDYKRCYTCNLEVDGYWNLMNHRKEAHPSNKKCRDFPDGKCRFGLKCWYIYIFKSNVI